MTDKMQITSRTQQFKFFIDFVNLFIINIFKPIYQARTLIVLSLVFKFSHSLILQFSLQFSLFVFRWFQRAQLHG